MGNLREANGGTQVVRLVNGPANLAQGRRTITFFVRSFVSADIPQG